MLGDRIIVNRNFNKRILAFIANPLIGIIIALLMSVFFYVISLSEKIPYYYITKASVATSQQTNGLKLTSNKKIIPELYYADLVLWNNGKQFIDFNDFIESKPIALSSNEIDSVIESNLLIKSRNDLQFTSRIFKNMVYIHMVGDEAIEQGDGVCYRIFFTVKGNKPVHFNLNSRVKGTKQGFEYKDFRKASKANHTLRIIIGWGVILGAILIRTITLLLMRKPVVFRRSELVIIMIALFVWCYYTYEYTYFAVDISWFQN